MAEIKLKPRTYRQRFLLAFIRQLNSEITAADLQLLVFLYTMEMEQINSDGAEKN